MAKIQLRALALFLLVFAFGSILLVACARPGTTSTANNSSSSSSSNSSSSSSNSNSGSSASSSSSSSSGPCTSGDTVKTSTTNFEQSCITLKKGATLKIVQDQTSFHILDYGQWSGSSAQPAAAPAGAPSIKDLKLSGPSVTIGPFTTAGTYSIYCTIHPNMNLKIVVQ